MQAVSPIVEEEVQMYSTSLRLRKPVRYIRFVVFELYCTGTEYQYIS